MAGVKEVSDATFESDVVKSSLPVLVDFWAPWCGPCRMVSPVVEELANDYSGKMSFVKLNTDDNPRTAVNYGIRSIPTLMIFKGGKVVGQVIGFRPKSDLKRQIDSILV